MRARHRIVTALLALYPAAWRNEYAAELEDILVARPLTSRVVADVVWSALRQRGRAAEPSTVIGLASMLVVLTGFVLTPTSYGRSWTALLRPSSKTLPTVTVTFLASEFYVVLLIGCGCWTNLRHGGTLNRSGVAAMKMSLIAGLPVMVGGLLMALGLLDARFLGASLGAPRHAPIPLAMMVAPLFRVPESWIWGAIGGQVGRWMSRSRRTASSS
jgi:hypothetical protein